MNMSSSTPPSREKYRALLASASKTAGSDNWKTSAGRINGPDGFVVGDAWRLLKINFKSTSKPSICPVCMDRPGSEDEWYITKSCRHAVCRTCLQSYALSLISDPNHTGPLKCPCCPRLLRVEDAKVALDKQLDGSGPINLSKRSLIRKPSMKRASLTQKEQGLFADTDANSRSSSLEVLEKWDNKARDQFLQSMREFRPCPHCSKDSGNDNGAQSMPNKGGGFVTPDCLAPINEERETKSRRLLCLTGSQSAHAVLLVYAVYYTYCGSIDIENPFLQVVMAILPCAALPIFPHALRLFLAAVAKREIMRPIVVTCPCCLKPFNLEASSELQLPDSSSDSAAEAATQRWKNSNTRPCPGCSSPIIKNGGCNHIKCSRCRVDFCWACMRPRTSCRAYQCKHGAPFGNAFGNGCQQAVREGLAALEREGQGQTLLEQIDSVEATALGNLRVFWAFPLRYAALIGVVIVFVSCLTRHTTVIAWIAIKRILTLAATLLLASVWIVCAVIIFTLICHNIPRLLRNCRRGRAGANWYEAGVARRVQQGHGVTGFSFNMRRRQSSLLGQFRFRTEDEMVSEAIRRSLIER
ncbi:hypothetical protein ACHAWF_008399 [Thalassiosira exigua]